MNQLTFATGTFESYRKPTRREKFLAEMERAVPWRELCAAIEPVYPKAGMEVALQIGAKVALGEMKWG